MTYRRNTGAPRAPVVLTLLLLLTLVPVAPSRADAGSDETGDSWERVLTALGCAAAIYKARVTGDIISVVTACGVLFISELRATGSLR